MTDFNDHRNSEFNTYRESLRSIGINAILYSGQNDQARPKTPIIPDFKKKVLGIPAGNKSQIFSIYLDKNSLNE